MADAGAPEPVKLIAAILWADSAALDSALESLARTFGAVDFAGPDHDFDATDYYTAEMGRGLRRRIVAFRGLIGPDRIVEAKIAARAIEDGSRDAGRRRVNIDVGYIDASKVVLASLKPQSQKIYLRDGVYADFVLRYRKGRLERFDWTFPDFRGTYDAELLAIRREYKRQLAAR